MSLFGEIKCGRCDRHYSGARSKCPYCGARKSRSGRRLDTTDANGGWKLLVGIIILILIVVAVVVVILISSGENGDDAQNPSSPNISSNASPNTTPNDSNGVTSVDTTPLPSPVNPSPSPSQEQPPVSPSPAVQDLILNREDFTMSQVGESWSLDPQIVPDGLDVPITWTSDDENVAIVDLEGKVTAIGAGTTIVRATAGDVTAECIVRVSLG